MLKNIFVLIACSVFVYGMSIENIFTDVFHYINLNRNPGDTTNLVNVLWSLLELQTSVPDIGFNITDVRELTYLIEQANNIFELGYIHVNGGLVYAIQIGSQIYSVEPHTFHYLIYYVSYILI